jgi:hypothetical protein
MSRYLLTLAAAAALGVASLSANELTRPARFGALEGASVETAKAQAAAWLKTTGKADALQAQFDAIWKGEGTPLDKVLRTFELGNADAAKILVDARDHGTPAPTAVPAILKDANQPAFFKNNLALGYARALSQRAVHEESLEVLKLTTAEGVIDPAAYLFHKAIGEHAILDKGAAITTINRLLDDVATSPERYRTLAALMALDIHTWNEKDLGSIARKMNSVQRRLDLARGGPNTQKIQKDIVARLDEMIKELENKSKQDSQCQNDGNCPGGGEGQAKPGSGPPKGNNPSSPATESGIANIGGTGTVDKAKLNNLVQNWGNLPPREQARALQELTQGMSQRHREAIENYFRNIAVAQSRK